MSRLWTLTPYTSTLPAAVPACPKGVTVSHRSVLDFIPQFAGIFGINGDDILGNQAPFDFDVSVKDLYTALYTGAKVQIIPRAYFSQPTKLMDYLADHAVTTLVWLSAPCALSPS